MRTFESGATRGNVDGKLAYCRGISTQVLKRYMQYLDLHRLQEDGSIREWDNWKEGIPRSAYSDSLVRHTLDAVRVSQGLPAAENYTLEDLLCATIFNASGWLFELLVEKSGNRELYTAGSSAFRAKTRSSEIRTCGDCADDACERTRTRLNSPAPPGCFKPKKGVLMDISKAAKSGGLWYFAHPYIVQDAEGRYVLEAEEANFVLCNIRAGELIQAGYNIYSPVSMTHPIHRATVAFLKAKEHILWNWLDNEFIDIALWKGIIVAPLWTSSAGCLQEAERFKQRGLEVLEYEQALILGRARD